MLSVPINEIEAVYDKVLPECMSDLVPIYPCDLDGRVIAGRGPYHLATERKVLTRWGSKLTEAEALERGIPRRFYAR